MMVVVIGLLIDLAVDSTSTGVRTCRERERETLRVCASVPHEAHVRTQTINCKCGRAFIYTI